MLSDSRAQAPTALVVLMSRAWLVPVSSWTRGVTPPAFLMVTLLSGSRAAHSPSAPTTFTSTYKSHSFQKSHADTHLQYTYLFMLQSVVHVDNNSSVHESHIYTTQTPWSVHITYTDKVGLKLGVLSNRSPTLSLRNNSKEGAWKEASGIHLPVSWWGPAIGQNKCSMCLCITPSFFLGRWCSLSVHIQCQSNLGPRLGCLYSMTHVHSHIDMSDSTMTHWWHIHGHKCTVLTSSGWFDRRLTSWSRAFSSLNLQTLVYRSTHNTSSVLV